MSDRYVVISADTHAGADLSDYRPYLEAKYHDAFDAWAATFVNPFTDLMRDDADRNWDSTRRTAELEADGVVAEVIYPNTIPPFFESGSLVAAVPSPEDYELRIAGLRAHNRWMAEFCAEQPDRRAGIGQTFLNDLDDAIADVHWIADHGLRGGVLLPSCPPGASIEPLQSPVYDPFWRACEERGVVLNTHGGSGSPDYGDYAASRSLWLIEAAWFAHRPLWTMIMSGVFERFPGLRMVLAEQGNAWIPQMLANLDGIAKQIASGNVGVMSFADQAPLLTRLPSDYWNDNCSVAASFYHVDDCRRRAEIGVDKIMWGADYPHLEGTSPFSHEAIRRTFAGVPEAEVRAMLGGNAAQIYGFDLDVLQPLADRFGPSVEEVAGGLDAIPEGALSFAFRETVTAVL